MGNRPGQPPIYYGVLPDVSNCLGACAPSGRSAFEGTTIVAGHEMVEAMTDPGGNAWYASNGEIGDLCAWSLTTTKDIYGKNWTVQMLWSNRNGSCYSESN